MMTIPRGHLLRQEGTPWPGRGPSAAVPYVDFRASVTSALSVFGFRSTGGGGREPRAGAGVWGVYHRA